VEREERRLLRDQVRKIEKEERDKRNQEDAKKRSIEEEKRKKEMEERIVFERLQRQVEETAKKEEENRRKLEQMQKDQQFEYIASQYEFNDQQERDVFKGFVSMGFNPETVHALLIVYGISEQQKIIEIIPEYEAIKEMGYSNMQTLFTLKKFNKRADAISFLTEYQTLLDKGYQDSEEALGAYDHYKDVSQAAKYLQEFQVLAELGYPLEQVRSSLRSNQNDRSKALQQLLGE